MKFDETKAYWNSRADRKGTSVEATTNDVYLRELEIRTLKHWLHSLQDRIETVVDVGCGNGYSTIELAKQFPSLKFVGLDYAAAMIDAAKKLNAEAGITNTEFDVWDLTADDLPIQPDVVITDRVLINLPTWDAQKQAIDRIGASLAPGGHYLMIENFEEGQNAFNEIRRAFELDEIPIRDHNLFLRKAHLAEHLDKTFDVKHRENISSMYYLVSRILYSQLCKENGSTPDYYDEHHRIGSLLPFAGEYGPIELYVLERQSRGEA